MSEKIFFQTFKNSHFLHGFQPFFVKFWHQSITIQKCFCLKDLYSFKESLNGFLGHINIQALHFLSVFVTKNDLLCTVDSYSIITRVAFPKLIQQIRDGWNGCTWKDADINECVHKPVDAEMCQRFIRHSISELEAWIKSHPQGSKYHPQNFNTLKGQTYCKYSILNELFGRSPLMEVCQISQKEPDRKRTVRVNSSSQLGQMKEITNCSRSLNLKVRVIVKTAVLKATLLTIDSY